LGVWHSLKVSAAVTDASGYTKITFVYIDGAGSLAADDKVFLSFVASGEDGAIPGYRYTFDTSTSDADPGSGDIRFNNGTYASATVIYIDDADADGGSTAADVQTWGDSNETVKGFLHITDMNDITTYARFKITAAVTDASGYNKITVVHLASNNTFSASDELSVHFTRNGDAGVSPGYSYKFDTGTSAVDPGAGEIAFNNGTYASATAIYIDDVDQNSVNTVTDVLSWDDSTSTIKGYLHIGDINDSSTYARFSITGSSTDGSGFNTLVVTHIASSNTFSAADSLSVHFTRQGDKGTKGAIASYNYNFDTSTTDADPGSGDVRFNHGTYSSVTAIYIDDAEANGVDVSADVLTWDDSTSTIKGYLHIVDTDDATTFARFSITGATTDASGYNKLSVTHLSSNNTFSAADSLSVHFSPYGLKGDTGATGSTAGTAGLGMTWESTTSDADPGAGKIAFNNATLSSVSVLYVDDADDASADISGFVQSWDDVDNSASRGFVHVVKEGTTSTYALYKVNGAVTDASGYTKVPVAHVVSAGSFSDDDGVGVQFVQSGADGEGSGDMNDVVDDTSPQLGGDLDLNNRVILYKPLYPPSNLNSIGANITTNITSTRNYYLLGPITVSSSYTWIISGTGEFRIL
jgi:hypothetical protein